MTFCGLDQLWCETKVLGPPAGAEYASKVYVAAEGDPLHAAALVGTVKTVPSSFEPSGLTAKESICCVEVIGKVAATATVPLIDRLRTTPLASAKKTLPAATCADGGRIAPMHPNAGTGIGVKVVFARA